jgi:hypothetical protein
MYKYIGIGKNIDWKNISLLASAGPHIGPTLYLAIVYLAIEETQEKQKILHVFLSLSKQLHGLLAFHVTYAIVWLNGLKWEQKGLIFN